jgi:hypothetical protein
MNRINSIKSEFGVMPCRGSHQQESATMTTTTSRRAILAGAASLASLSALATPTASPDPIFAAIEAHRAARAAYWTPIPGETDEESDERLGRTCAPADEALIEQCR